MNLLTLGMVRVGVCSPELRVADVEFNTQKIIEALDLAVQKECAVIVFPELGITGYTCADLFFQPSLLQTAKDSLVTISNHLETSGNSAIVGLPIAVGGILYNAAAFISGGNILGIIPKTYLPNYNEFYEERWFSSANDCGVHSIEINGKSIPFGTNILFQAENSQDCIIGIEICEDLWSVIPPSSIQALSGATILANLSASDELLGKYDYRQKLVQSQSARCFAAYLYAGAGSGESTTDLVYAGHSLIAENGILLTETERFEFSTQIAFADIDVARLVSERIRNNTFAATTGQNNFRIIPFHLNDSTSLERSITQSPFVPSDISDRDNRCSEIFALQSTGLAKRLRHIGGKSIVIGISGGLDSTLALLATVKTFDKLGIDRSGIVAISMPGFGSTNRTQANAVALASKLGITLRIIPIAESVHQHFKDLGHDETIHNILYENAQARERTQILMDAAHQTNAIVVGTGDLSELALGWCTYNGDHISMYGINSGIPKTLVRYIVEYASEKDFLPVEAILQDILATPVSPELLPPDMNGLITQKTEEAIGDYILHDFFLYYAIRLVFPPKKIYAFACKAFEGTYTPVVIKKWLRVFYQRFFSQQFKRSCLPDGVKIGSVALSPRSDWRMPSDASAALWLKEIDEL
ncbi:MAG: NAD(+) synthase [Ignavibacteriae bacterium]|nr:NAD(+) synthase [Ignavibacteriota bacterium]